MAARASLSVPFGAESTTSPVAGLIRSYVCPELEPVGSPAINIFPMIYLQCNLWLVKKGSILQFSESRSALIGNRISHQKPPNHYGVDPKGYRRQVRTVDTFSLRCRGGKGQYFCGPACECCSRIGCEACVVAAIR